METADIKRINNLVVRMGDQGKTLYKRDLLKFADIAIGYSQSESLVEEIFKKFREAIRVIPGKHLIYAATVTYLQPNYSEQVEKLIDSLFEDLTNSLNEQNELVASNILLFFSELTLLGLMNAFTFISVLMDMVARAEEYRQLFPLIVRLVLEAVILVRDFYTDKYELEFKNLMEDLGRIFRQAHNWENMNISYEQEFYEAVRLLVAGSTENIFHFPVQDVYDVIKNVKAIRKNFKMALNPIAASHSHHSFARNSSKIKILREKVMSAAGNQHSVNIYIINSFLYRMIQSFKRSPELMLEKVFAMDYVGYSEMKNYLLIENLFSLLLSNDLPHEDNSLFIAKVFADLVSNQNQGRVLAESLRSLSTYVESNIHTISLRAIIALLKILSFVGFHTSELYILELSDSFPHRDYFILIQSFFNQKSKSFCSSRHSSSSQSKSRLID